jgi:signal transduction histidine kinase
VEVLAQVVEAQTQSAERMLRITVADRGPGLEGQVTAQAARRGTGVGLAVCQAIARVHGGQLRGQSRPGGGAQFELLLPVGSPPEGLPPDAVMQEQVKVQVQAQQQEQP